MCHNNTYLPSTTNIYIISHRNDQGIDENDIMVKVCMNLE